MEKHVITAAVLTEILDGTATIDTLLVVTAGFGVLCLGDATGIDVADCIPVEAGDRFPVAAGLEASAAQFGGSLTIIAAPYSVEA